MSSAQVAGRIAVILGPEYGNLARMLLLKRPKWMKLLLYVASRGVAGFSELRSLLRMNTRALQRALSFLSSGEYGVSPGYVSPVKLLRVARMGRSVYVMPTDAGARVAGVVLDVLRDEVVRLGEVDVERELGVVKKQLDSIVREKTRVKGEIRYVDFERAKERMPLLAEVVDPELLGIRWVTVRIGSRRSRIAFLVVPGT